MGKTYNVLYFSITKFMPYESLFSHLCQLKITQPFRFEIQSLLSNCSIPPGSPPHHILPFLLTGRQLGSGQRGRRVQGRGVCHNLHLLPSLEPSSSLWPPSVAARSTHLASWHHGMHQVSRLLSATSGELRVGLGGGGAWAFLMDPHTTLANSERLHPEKSTDI